MPNATLINLRNIGQVYHAGARAFAALESINLQIAEGEFVGFVGPAGCGKSTLLRIVTGLQPATSGEVLYRGEPQTGINPNATIVFQSFALFPWLTVQENVEVALQSQGLPKSLRATRAVKFLDIVGLDGFETAYPRELSRGMRQKVGVARAMALEPELLCLDEPFSALDVLSAKVLRDELLDLWLTKKLPTQAIVLVTHNIEEAVALVDRIIVMDKGPGRVITTIKVELPHPRQPKSPGFVGYVDRVFAALAGQTESEQVEMGAAPGAGGKIRPLVDVPLNGLTGLLEHLDEVPNNRADIYSLVHELQVPAEELLPLTEAAELLGFATIAHGDISLTALGETFSTSSVLARKEIFAARVKRLPFFKWLLRLLRDADNHQMHRNLLDHALESEFPPEDAQQQIRVAINWGRYAEVLAYDDDQETLYLETRLDGSAETTLDNLPDPKDNPLIGGD